MMKRLTEGKRRKGGVGEKPTTPRPAPPKGQVPVKKGCETCGYAKWPIGGGETGTCLYPISALQLKADGIDELVAHKGDWASNCPCWCDKRDDLPSFPMPEGMGRVKRLGRE